MMSATMPTTLWRSSAIQIGSDNRVTILWLTGRRPAATPRHGRDTATRHDAEHNLIYIPYGVRQDVFVPGQFFRRRARLEVEI